MDGFVGSEQAVEHALLCAFRKQAHLRGEVHPAFFDVVDVGQNTAARTLQDRLLLRLVRIAVDRDPLESEIGCGPEGPICQGFCFRCGAASERRGQYRVKPVAFGQVSRCEPHLDFKFAGRYRKHFHPLYILRKTAENTIVWSFSGKIRFTPYPRRASVPQRIRRGISFIVASRTTASTTGVGGLPGLEARCSPERVKLLLCAA